MQTVTWPGYVFPMAAALLYAVGALCIKRAMAGGIGPWRTTFLSNVSLALVFAPLYLLWGHHPPGPEALWWQPLTTGFLFFTGQIFTFLALAKGDVSVATPLLGTKIILVAFFSQIFIPGGIPLTWWVAALLSTFAVAIFSAGTRIERRRLAPTILFSITSAAAFAATDVFVQKWTGLWGAGRFLPIMFLSMGLYSLAFVPFFQGSLFRLPGSIRPWILAGALIIAVQGLMMALALGVYGNATVANILYSSRGLWSLILVWFAGHWFLNAEKGLGRAVFLRRGWGAFLLFASIVLIFV